MNKRRKLMLAFGAVLLALPLFFATGVSFAQPRIPLVTVLIHATESAGRPRLDAFLKGMGELGYAEGKNFRMEVRWSDGQLDRLPVLARELLLLKPDVAVAAPVVSAQAFFRESKTVPIVMASGAGALRVGLVASLARPGGNVTGVTNQGDELTQKYFELLGEIAPRAKRVMTLSSGQAASEPDVRSGSRVAAKAYGMTLIEAWADSTEKISQLAALCARERCEALVVLLDPFLTSRRMEVIALAARLRLPAIYYTHEFVEEGGLVSYSTDYRTGFHRAAAYVDKILKGAKAGDLPVEQPTTFELVINMKTAKALGLKIPNTVLVRAERVIE
jgi:putative ABC transport system substrate-binding protein